MPVGCNAFTSRRAPTLKTLKNCTVIVSVGPPAFVTRLKSFTSNVAPAPLVSVTVADDMLRTTCRALQPRDRTKNLPALKLPPSAVTHPVVFRFPVWVSMTTPPGAPQAATVPKRRLANSRTFCAWAASTSPPMGGLDESPCCRQPQNQPHRRFAHLPNNLSAVRTTPCPDCRRVRKTPWLILYQLKMNVIKVPFKATVIFIYTPV